MGFSVDNPLFLIPLLTGLIFMLAGIIMLKFPPEKINFYYGYRTKSSMKNQERWNFAQKYSSIESIKLGGILFLSAAIGFVYNPDEKTAVFLGLGLMIITAIILLIRVEKAIKKKFKNER